MKRALGVAVLGGGLLALNAGAAGAQEVSADVSARLGRSTSAEVRVCADGRILSRLLGSCSNQPRSGGASVSVDAGRDSDGSRGVRARARVPRVADADVSVGARRSRPSATASGQASAARRARADADASVDTSPRARADAAASLSRPRAGRLLDLDAEIGLAGVGLLGSSLFTLAGDPAADTLLPTGELTLDGLGGEAPAGIGVLETGPIASGNQVGVDVGNVSPSVPVTVCGNSVGVLGATSASCGATQPSAAGASTGSSGTGSTGTSAGTGSSTSGSPLADLASGNQVDAGIGSVSPSVPVTVCGNSVGVLGDASASCGASQQAADGTSSGSTSGSASGSTGASARTGTLTSGALLDGLASGNQVDAGIGSVSPSVPVTVCGNSVGVLGDASASCGANGGAAPSTGTGVDLDTTLDIATNATGLVDSGPSTDGGTSISIDTGPGGDSGTDPGTDPGAGVDIGPGVDVSLGGDISTGGIIAPTPGTTPGTDQGRTDTVGTTGTTGTTGTSGIPGTFGLIPGTSGGAGEPVTTFAPLRPFASGSGALPFTGATSDLLAMVAAGLLAAGALFVRAARPAAATEGGGDR